MNKYSHEQYINKLNRLNTTMRPLEDYVGYHNKILHRCNKCGNVLLEQHKSVYWR